MPSGVEAGQAGLCHIITKSICTVVGWDCGPDLWAHGLPRKGTR